MPWSFCTDILATTRRSVSLIVAWSELTGPVIDQAALHGILNRSRGLGVPLLSVKRLSADGIAAPSSCE